jgi:hypothetical protein
MQFCHFNRSFCSRVLPPFRRDALPPLDEAIKTIKVKNPIMQEINGSAGTYRQTNIEKLRSYNLPQWKQLCEGSEHQPPARRGERRLSVGTAPRPSTRRSTATAAAAAAASQTPGNQNASPSTPQKRRPGRPRKSTVKVETTPESAVVTGSEASPVKGSCPLTPAADASPTAEVSQHDGVNDSLRTDAVQAESACNISDAKNNGAAEPETEEPSNAKGRQPKSVSSRRKYNRGTAADVVDEAAFVGFDYRIHNQDEYTQERCQELERSYWKSVTYNSPLYGADMPGSLFNDSVTSWNVAKLDNLLDVLGQKIPGVNTAYLYLGMWKSTFAWHLEDVDLYSINYIHFGAPKQWYSISQEDAPRFEAAMKREIP